MQAFWSLHPSHHQNLLPFSTFKQTGVQKAPLPCVVLRLNPRRLPCLPGKQQKLGGISNNGTERRAVGAPPAHKSTDWIHNDPFFSPSYQVCTTWTVSKTTDRKTHGSEGKNCYSPGSHCGTLHPTHPPVLRRLGLNSKTHQRSDFWSKKYKKKCFY